MKTSIVLVRIGGVFHLVCAVTHLFFPVMFQWDEHLAPLSGDAAAVVSANLNIMNWCLLVLWIMLGVIPLVHPRELVTTGMGRMFLAFIVLFWVVRLFVLQPVFVGLRTGESLVTVGVLGAGFMFFLVPFIRTLAGGNSAAG